MPNLRLYINGLSCLWNTYIPYRCLLSQSEIQIYTKTHLKFGIVDTKRMWQVSSDMHNGLTFLLFSIPLFFLMISIAHIDRLCYLSFLRRPLMSIEKVGISV